MIAPCPPLVTIGITAFNAQDTIARAIDSAFAQDWPNVEVVIVDDCSTDLTANWLDEVARSGSNVRLVKHSQNLGVGAARNTILSQARGEYVVFFDDDDESLPHRITCQIARLTGYEATQPRDTLVICHSARRQIFPNGFQRIEPTMGEETAHPAPQGVGVVKRILTGKTLHGGYGSLATCSQLARRSTYERVGGFDPRLRRGEDTDLSIRLGIAGAHFVGVAEPLVVQHMTLASEKTLTMELSAALVVLRKHRGQFGSERELKFSEEWLGLKFDWISGRQTQFLFGIVKSILQYPIFTVARLIYAVPMASSRISQRMLYRPGPFRGGALGAP